MKGAMIIPTGPGPTTAVPLVQARPCRPQASTGVGLRGGWRWAMGLDVEADVDDLAFGDDVILAFQAKLSLGAGFGEPA